VDAVATAAALSGFFFVIVKFRARLVGVCRKSIQLAGFHGAKLGAIVPGIRIFTTPPPSPPPLHAGERPAIITAISVSGIFQPFLVALFSFPPSSTALFTSTTIWTIPKETHNFPKVHRSLETLSTVSSHNRTLQKLIWSVIVRKSADATQPCVLAQGEKIICRRYAIEKWSVDSLRGSFAVTKTKIQR